MGGPIWGIPLNGSHWGVMAGVPLGGVPFRGGVPGSDLVEGDVVAHHAAQAVDEG